MEVGLKTRVIQRPGQILAMGHTPMSNPEQIRKMKELGVRPGIGPMHLFGLAYLEPGFLAYGSERLMEMEPYRIFLDDGVRASLEGDNVGPIFWKIQMAVTRKDDKYGRVWNDKYKITREEALRMSTNNGAYQLGEEDKLGSVEAGKLGDIIVIDKDFFTVPEQEISKIKVLMTVLGGKVVYEVEGGLK
jgi:predicted amidohydrolase YtcJ